MESVPLPFDLTKAAEPRNSQVPFSVWDDHKLANTNTKIKLTLTDDKKVSLSIYDVSGRLVSTLINNEFKQANYYSVSFNGASLSSGTYFYSIRTDNNNETKKT